MLDRADNLSDKGCRKRSMLMSYPFQRSRSQDMTRVSKNRKSHQSLLSETQTFEKKENSMKKREPIFLR
jgi:hypothetical protein